VHVKLGLCCVVLAAPLAAAQQAASPTVALTIYNHDFAVARTSIDLDLHKGVNEVTTTAVTSRLEPDSVILRDPTGKRVIHVEEQNYDAAVVSENWLLQKYEGKTIDFQMTTPDGPKIVEGRIIRAGFNRESEVTFDEQQIQGLRAEPLIEVDGKLQFGLPGKPLFPASTDGLLLKPTLRWQIDAPEAEHFSAELAYITGGLDWEATYNVVLPAAQNPSADEAADVLGWVTIHNQSGTDFAEARIKLMAGDVAKLEDLRRMMQQVPNAGNTLYSDMAVSQKSFDDFHLYDLNRTVALRDGETKQVQFLDASDVTVHRSYLYDGAAKQWDSSPYRINDDQNFGLDNDNTQVHIAEEIGNTTAHHLGVPLPAGRMRLYRRDADGQMEFVGEDIIRHTPVDETLSVVSGSAFDLKGSRRQRDYSIDSSGRRLHESFEIKVKNDKEQPAHVAIVEHLYRGMNWDIVTHSSHFTKVDSKTVHFDVDVPAKGEFTVDYTVVYSW
jgi:hypothetical protein